MWFVRSVKNKYQVIAIIPKEKFERGTPYNTKFYTHFDKEKFKEVMPKLTTLFRQMNNGLLKSTIVMDFSGTVTALKGIDRKMIVALQKLGYEINEDMYKAGIVKNDSGKQIPILDVLKTKATKIRGYDKLKEQYEKTKNEKLKKELEFYDVIIDMDILDSSKKIDIKKLSIYDNDKAKIVFTYNHRALASQSTSVGWDSCMNLDKTTGYNQHVGGGASEGKFIAYLVKKDDEYTLKSPTARVLFKPYFGQLTGDIIWKADKVYGMAPSNFRTTSQEIVDKYLRPQQDIYHLTSKTYVDRNGANTLKKTISTIEYKGSLLTLKKNPNAITDIENPTEIEKFVAVQKDYNVISKIKNPSEQIQQVAVKQGGKKALKLIKDMGIEPSDKLVKMSKGVRDVSALALAITDHIPELVSEMLGVYSDHIQENSDFPGSDEWERGVSEDKLEKMYIELLDDATLSSSTQELLTEVEQLYEELNEPFPYTEIGRQATSIVTSQTGDDVDDILYTQELPEQTYDDYLANDRENIGILEREDELEELNRLLPGGVSLSDSGRLSFGEGAYVYLVLDDLEELKKSLELEIKLINKDPSVDADSIVLDRKADKSLRLLALDSASQDAIKKLITRTEGNIIHGADQIDAPIIIKAVTKLDDAELLDKIVRIGYPNLKIAALERGKFTDVDYAKNELMSNELFHYPEYRALLLQTIKDPQWVLSYLNEYKQFAGKHDSDPKEAKLHDSRKGIERNIKRLGSVGLISVKYDDGKKTQTLQEFLESKEYVGKTIKDSLSFSNSDITYIPEGLDVEGDIYARHCQSLTKLPKVVKTEDISNYYTLFLDGCKSLREIPEGFDCINLSLINCTALKQLPSGFDGRDIDIRGCTGLELIPDDLDVRKITCDNQTVKLIPENISEDIAIHNADEDED